MATHRSRRRARAVLTCALVLACAPVAACSSGFALGGVLSSPSAGEHPPASGPGTDPPATGPTAKPSATHKATVAAPSAACVTEIYDRMTLAQRVGQLFLVGLDQDVAGPVTTAALERYHFGSLLMGRNTAAGVSSLSGATGHIQSLATAAITGGARFFVAANQEGGEVQSLTGPGFSPMPSALAQGSWPVATLREQAAVWGGELRAAGVNLDLAPVMDVVPPGTASTNAPIGQFDRQFGFDPRTNGTHGAAFIAGMASAGVATTAKHFPGLGRVTGNTDHTSDVVDSVTTPNDPYLGSFRDAIGAGVPFVMVSLATYTKIDPERLAVFSPTVMQLLRGELGFGGVIMSDDLGEATAVASIPAGERAIGFLSAGGDMITSQTLAPAETMASAVLAKATADASFRTVVDSAAERVLDAKQAYHLLPC